VDALVQEGVEVARLSYGVRLNEEVERCLDLTSSIIHHWRDMRNQRRPFLYRGRALIN
jgi:hypothetical protein